MCPSDSWIFVTMNFALKIFSTTKLLYFVEKRQLREWQFKKDEKQNRLRSKKHTIGIYDALCSDRRIEDTGSHRLKITERDRKTSSRKTEPTALCSSVCSRRRSSPLLSARCSQRLQPAGWRQREWGIRREERLSCEIRNGERDWSESHSSRWNLWRQPGASRMTSSGHSLVKRDEEKEEEEE